MSESAPPTAGWGWGCFGGICIVVVIVGATVMAVSRNDHPAVGGAPVTISSTPDPVETIPAVTEQQAGEKAFVALLKSGYPQYATASDASVIAVGQAVCDELGQGKTYIIVSLEVAGTGKGLSATDGATIAGWAIGSMCEQYKDEVTAS
ncbi:DUF732 domain-containing protein [Kribbella sp. NBC_01484]|uniref:DUF732 domain-containing protein n=1 Tax=Kribbella sp. NBC_01484 TaxID=2903579 RepID=UPI002E31F994|nr:DUF732 domain-containing protein [Kribbella sp. NBC_01484]